MDLKLIAAKRQMQALHNAFGQHLYVDYLNKDTNAIVRICKGCLSLDPNRKNMENFAKFISNCDKKIINIEGERVNIVDFYIINNHILKYFPHGIWQFFDKEDILLTLRDNGLPSIYILKAKIKEFHQRFGNDMDMYVLTSEIEEEI